MDARKLSVGFVSLALLAVACAFAQQAQPAGQPAAKADEKQGKNEQPEPGEVKVKLEETPPAVQKTIKDELVGAELEDIAKVRRQGKTVYEVDIIKGEHKWEVVIGEDGQIISKLQEGSAAEQAADKLGAGAAPGGDGWLAAFDVNKADLKPTGTGKYFVLQPGHKMTYAGGDVVLVITVLDETKVLDGVTTRVAEERESKAGVLVEISRNYHAIDTMTGDVYYFGEDVDIYKDGKVINHEGTWLAGKDGARFGLFIPGSPRVGDKFYQEIAAGNALDRFEIVSRTERIETPAGVFENVVHADETTPLEPGHHGNKWYAPGVGMIIDDDLKLTKIEPAPAKK